VRVVLEGLVKSIDVAYHVLIMVETIRSRDTPRYSHKEHRSYGL
jgi:hypothetical protein